MSDSVQPHRWQPTRLPHPGDSPGKNTGVGCHFLLHCIKVKSESEVAQSCLTLSNPMDCSYQAPLSMGFSRQEYWSGLPSPSLMYSAYKLNKLTVCTLTYSFPNLEPVHCSMSSSNCCFLISQEAGKVVWYSISLRIFHNLL